MDAEPKRQPLRIGPSVVADASVSAGAFSHPCWPNRSRFLVVPICELVLAPFDPLLKVAPF
jgi:hypothetical protein